MPNEPLLLGTANRDKVREFRELAAAHRVAVRSADELGVRLPAVAEEGQTAAANARLKACQSAARTRHWTLADDTVLEVEAIGGRPGVYTARYAGARHAGAVASPAANRAKLLKDLAAVPAGQRGARFVCHLCVADGAGRVQFETAGECLGEILTIPRGEGFGYDNLFFVAELGKTMAEFSQPERVRLTHRGRAFEQLARWLIARA